MEQISPDITCDTPRIRPVDTANIGDLIRIANETNLSHWSAQSYLEEIKNRDSIMLRLVGGDNETLGFVVGRIIPGSVVEKVLEAEIYNIAVTETHQRKGLGQTLFDSFRSECLEKKAANIWLEVRESNSKAIAFYEKNRFESIQTRTHFYENPREHAILMKLELSAEQTGSQASRLPML